LFDEGVGAARSAIIADRGWGREKVESRKSRVEGGRASHPQMNADERGLAAFGGTTGALRARESRGEEAKRNGKSSADERR
jgi:hypothetical protein